jgi:hypothetical protein
VVGVVGVEADDVPEAAVEAREAGLLGAVEEGWWPEPAPEALRPESSPEFMLA